MRILDIKEHDGSWRTVGPMEIGAAVRHARAIMLRRGAQCVDVHDGLGRGFRLVYCNDRRPDELQSRAWKDVAVSDRK